MLPTLLKLSWLNLKRDRVALLLMFALPIAFFSIFAMIFGGSSGGSGGGGPRALRVIVVDEDQSTTSSRFAASIAEQDALRVTTAPRATGDAPEPAPYDRESARRRVRGGDADAAVVLPKGFGDGFARFDGQQVDVDLYYDAANPVVVPTLSGLLQAAALTAAPDALMENGFEMLDQAGGFLTDEQRRIIGEFSKVMRGETDEPDLPALPDDDAVTATPATDAFAGFVPVNAIDARAGDEPEEEQNRQSIVSYYAAGIGVMFLLFSMVGAGGSILEEEEAGTLERLLTSNVSMTTLILANWLFFTLCGIGQLVLMFTFGWLVYDVDLWSPSHLAGFAAMTLVTAPAAAAFGIIFATACRTRAQLSGVSTIVILVMSALGGSMVPRFAMPEFMNTTALFTFNGWALDGYLKVFWYDDPDAGIAGTIASLLPQLTVLAATTVVFLWLARMFARRWERG